MIKNKKSGSTFYEFEIFQDFKNILNHAVFTRRANLNKTNVNLAEITWFVRQMHGSKSIILKRAESAPKKPQKHLEGDAFITAIPGIPIGVRIADCASILIFDPKKKVIANIHAGWRGLSQKIISKTITKMSQVFNCNPCDFLAGISPMIGPCCCHFKNPQGELPRFLHRFITEENTVDLWAAVESALVECGVKKTNIENPRICTFCTPEDFYSYRREGGDKRFGAAIEIRTSP